MIATPLLYILSAGLAASSPTAYPARDYLLALAPPDAMAVAALGDMDEIRAGIKKNAWLRFARDEEVAALVGHFEGLFGGELRPDWGQLDELGFDPSEFLASLSGSAVLFSDVPGGNPDDMVLGLLVELGEDREPFHELVEKLLDRSRAEGATVTGGEYQGASVTAVSPPDDDEGAAYLAELGDVIAVVASGDREAALARVRGVVDRWSGASEGGSLLSNETYQLARSRSSFDPQLEVFVDLSVFWKHLMASGELDQAPPMLAAELERIGWVRCAGRLGEGEETDLEVLLGAPEDGLFAAVASLLGGVPVDLVERIPRNAKGVITMSIDFAGAGALAKDLAREFDPESYQEMQAGLQLTQALGVDVEEDVLSELTGEFASFSIEVPAQESLLGAAGGVLRGLSGSSVAPTYGRVFMLGVRDTASVSATLERITGSVLSQDAGAEDHVESVFGHEVHAANLWEGLVSIRMYWSAIEGALLLSMQPTALREALRMTTDDGIGIGENGVFASVIEENRRASALAITDTAASLGVLLDTLRSLSSGIKLASALTGKPIDEMLPIGPDTPWPDISVVDRYFGGVSFKAFEWSDGAMRLHIASR